MESLRIGRETSSQTAGMLPRRLEMGTKECMAGTKEGSLGLSEARGGSSIALFVRVLQERLAGWLHRLQLRLRTDSCPTLFSFLTLPLP